MRPPAVLLTLMLAAGTLTAQAPTAPTAPSEEPRNAHKGFWISVGLGTGSAGVDCSSCSNDRTNGFSGGLRLGGTLSQQWLLGFESNGWFHSESGVDETLAFGNVVAAWYPSRTGAFYLKFGLGGMSYKATDGVDDLTATAPAATLGIGYDFRVGRNFSVTPYLNSLATSAASFKVNGTSAPTNEDITISLVQFGVAASWH